MRMCHFCAQNDPFVMNNFFLVQSIIITFIYQLVLFFVQNFKDFLQPIQSHEDAPFLGPKWSIYTKPKIFWKIINTTLIYLLAPFIVRNFLKIATSDPELWGCTIFVPKMTHLWWTILFWYKALSLLSSTSWSFSLCKTLKIFYSRSRVMKMHHFWVQNGPFTPNQKFFGKLLIPLSSTY